MSLSKQNIRNFQRFIFDWWERNKRDLPWRYTHDPYRILVSEVMLQQTQVSRVLPKYDEFLHAFPNIHVLAHASPGEVLRLWKGMGYNRRALFLKKAAEIVVKKHEEVFPQDEKTLRTLPGIGSYTARAIMVFAYKKDVSMIDTNIRQIITRYFFDGKPQSEKIIQQTVDQLVPKGKSWEWHQALMDYGALEMKKSALKVHTGKKQGSFKDSNRLYRGRIIDLLREKKMKESELTNYMAETYKKEKEFVIFLLGKLEHDGLIMRSKTGIISLPV